jgi:hypothetical protein
LHWFIRGQTVSVPGDRRRYTSRLAFRVSPLPLELDSGSGVPAPFRDLFVGIDMGGILRRRRCCRFSLRSAFQILRFRERLLAGSQPAGVLAERGFIRTCGLRAICPSLFAARDSSQPVLSSGRDIGSRSRNVDTDSAVDP